MPSRMEKIEAEALKLNVVELARLAESLLSSLEKDSGIEEAWAAIARAFLSEFERVVGLIRTYPDIGTPWKKTAR